MIKDYFDTDFLNLGWITFLLFTCLIIYSIRQGELECWFQILSLFLTDQSAEVEQRILFLHSSWVTEAPWPFIDCLKSPVMMSHFLIVWSEDPVNKDRVEMSIARARIPPLWPENVFIEFKKLQKRLNSNAIGILNFELWNLEKSELGF